ncbi:putative UPF0665 family protein C23C4.06c [Glarea lozoyensis 74030]|uniref:Putative UPF0665 family protein C23C4.06c n=1 Tax=Glarea lozoyensis (strain ATCC 74030 / MF5533) TaxID=1104152 RepID=H0EGD5_GLAL7|nr:putative UPF0665 family protein C23C4.06c [Glarea lozoyensis 74030]
MSQKGNATSSNTSQPPLAERVFNTGKEGKDLHIWEETGESIARHIWYAYQPNLPILNSILTTKPSLKILELGAGCGIVGISLSTLPNTTQIILTDLPEATDILTQNLSSLPSDISHEVLDWSAPLPAHIAGTEWDLIAISDCTYNPDVVPDLVKTLGELARGKEVYVVLAMKVRHESELVFFELMDKKGFEVREKMKIELPVLGGEGDMYLTLFSNKFYAILLVGDFVAAGQLAHSIWSRCEAAAGDFEELGVLCNEINIAGMNGIQGIGKKLGFIGSKTERDQIRSRLQLHLTTINTFLANVQVETSALTVRLLFSVLQEQFGDRDEATIRGIIDNPDALQDLFKELRSENKLLNAELDREKESIQVKLKAAVENRKQDPGTIVASDVSEAQVARPIYNGPVAPRSAPYDPLPDDWSYFWQSEDTNEIVYVDNNTMTESTVHPARFNNTEDEVGTHVLPPGWQRRLDTWGNIFFVDHHTRRAVREDPRFNLKINQNTGLPDGWLAIEDHKLTPFFYRRSGRMVFGTYNPAAMKSKSLKDKWTLSRVPEQGEDPESLVEIKTPLARRNFEDQKKARDKAAALAASLVIPPMTPKEEAYYHSVFESVEKEDPFRINYKEALTLCTTFSVSVDLADKVLKQTDGNRDWKWNVDEYAKTLHRIKFELKKKLKDNPVKAKTAKEEKKYSKMFFAGKDPASQTMTLLEFNAVCKGLGPSVRNPEDIFHVTDSNADLKLNVDEFSDAIHLVMHDMKEAKALSKLEPPEPSSLPDTNVTKDQPSVPEEHRSPTEEGQKSNNTGEQPEREILQPYAIDSTRTDLAN